MEHDGCKGCRYERENADSINCQGCKQNAVDKYVKKTNFDLIKSMVLEELAELLVFYDGCYWYEKVTDTCCWASKEKSAKAVKEWLESECDTE